MAKHEIVGADGRRRWVDRDDGEVLADGEKLVVPLMLKDTADRLSDVQRAVAASKAQDDFATLCRRAYEIKERAYLDAKAELSDAWKTPTTAGAEVADRRRWHRVTSRDPQGRETGMAEWEEEDRRRRPPRASSPHHGGRRLADEGRRLKDQARDEMVADMCSAWKGNRA